MVLQKFESEIGKFIQNASHATNHKSDWVYQKIFIQSLCIQSLSSIGSYIY